MPLLLKLKVTNSIQKQITIYILTLILGQLKQAHDTLVNWIQVNFSEVYGGWVHLKVIRLAS